MNAGCPKVWELKLKDSYAGTGRDAMHDYCRAVGSLDFPIGLHVFNWDKKAKAMSEMTCIVCKSGDEVYRQLLFGTSDGKYCATFNPSNGEIDKILQMYSTSELTGFGSPAMNTWFPAPPPEVLIERIHSTTGSFVFFHDFDYLLFFDSTAAYRGG